VNDAMTLRLPAEAGPSTDDAARPNGRAAPNRARRMMGIDMGLLEPRHSAGRGRPSQAYAVAAVSAIISKGTTSTDPPETSLVASV
jgi:hypothetical protein